jgi:hypothetical protein
MCPSTGPLLSTASSLTKPAYFQAGGASRSGSNALNRSMYSASEAILSPLKRMTAQTSQAIRDEVLFVRTSNTCCWTSPSAKKFRRIRVVERSMNAPQKARKLRADCSISSSLRSKLCQVVNVGRQQPSAISTSPSSSASQNWSAVAAHDVGAKLLNSYNARFTSRKFVGNTDHLRPSGMYTIAYPYCVLTTESRARLDEILVERRLSCQTIQKVDC